MRYLVDTSILGRLANSGDQSHQLAIAAVTSLHKHGELLSITPQNVIEFRGMATRPLGVNGMGLSPPQVDLIIASFETVFPLIVETNTIYPIWKRIVTTAQVIGKQVHDARLVAICEANYIPRLLTFNIGHFSRLAKFASNLTIVDPATV